MADDNYHLFVNTIIHTNIKINYTHNKIDTIWDQKREVSNNNNNNKIGMHLQNEFIHFISMQDSVGNRS